MNKFNPTRNASEKNAQKYFTKADQSPQSAKKIARNERSFDAANTARLRALRLAKEAADKEAADKLATESPAKPAKRTARAAAAPKAPRTRMFY